MSHSAMSIALIAEQAIFPAGKKPPRNISCQRCSMRNGVLADEEGLEVLHHSFTASSRPVMPRLATPEIPSSVSTTTKKKFRPPPQTG